MPVGYVQVRWVSAGLYGEYAEQLRRFPTRLIRWKFKEEGDVLGFDSEDQNLRILLGGVFSTVRGPLKGRRGDWQES